MPRVLAIAFAEHFVYLLNVIAACQAKMFKLRDMVTQRVSLATTAATQPNSVFNFNYHHRLGNTDADPSHFTSFYIEMGKKNKLKMTKKSTK